MAKQIYLGNTLIEDQKIFLGDKPVKAIYLGSTLVYGGEEPTPPVPTTNDYYGVKFVGPENAGTRTGNLEYHKTLPILSKMKGCTITSDGVVKYLNPTDWTKYEDGTDRDYTLNTMVEIPEFYLYSILDEAEDSYEIRICEQDVEGTYTHIPRQYVGAYPAATVDDRITSIIAPLNSKLLPVYEFLNRARANGSAHWNMYTYSVHKAITWLMVVEFATRAILEDYILELTPEGYKQGGLGLGFTVFKTWVYTSVPNGITDTVGNGIGLVHKEIVASGETISWDIPRYRGIENPFGPPAQFVIDLVAVQNPNDRYDQTVYINRDYTKFPSTMEGFLENFLPTDMKLLTGANDRPIGKLVDKPSAELIPLTTLADGDLSYFRDIYSSHTYVESLPIMLTFGAFLTTNYIGLRGMFNLDVKCVINSEEYSDSTRLTYLI